MAFWATIAATFSQYIYYIECKAYTLICNTKNADRQPCNNVLTMRNTMCVGKYVNT